MKLPNISFQRWMKCQIMNMLHMEWEMINTRKENFAMAKNDDEELCLHYRTNPLFYARNTLRKLTSDIALATSSKDSDLQPVRHYRPCRHIVRYSFNSMAIALGRAYQDARAVQSDVELHDGEISVRNIHARIVRRLTIDSGMQPSTGAVA